MGIMEGRDRHHIQDKYRDLFVPLIKANWQVWPIAQVCYLLLAPASTTDTDNPVCSSSTSDSCPYHTVFPSNPRVVSSGRFTCPLPTQST